MLRSILSPVLTFIEGALRFLVNKKNLGLYSVLLIRSVCVNPWGQTNVLNAFFKADFLEHFEFSNIYIHVYSLAVFFFSFFAFVGTLPSSADQWNTVKLVQFHSILVQLKQIGQHQQTTWNRLLFRSVNL